MNKLQRESVKEAKKQKWKDIFLSPEYKSRLLSIINAASMSVNCGRNIDLQIIYDTKMDSVAFTNGSTITVNLGSSFGKRLRNNPEKYHLLIIGLIAHELGHIFWTDFADGEKYCQSILKGQLYPEVPQHPNADKLQEALKDEKNRDMLSQMCHMIDNLLEDIFVNALQRKFFKGTFTKGINLGNVLVAEESLNIKHQKAQQYDEFVIYVNTLITKLKFSAVYYGGFENEYKDKIDEIYKLSKKNIFSAKHSDRCKTVNTILCVLWDEVKQILDKIQNQPKQQNSNGSSNENSNEESSGSEAGNNSSNSGNNGSQTSSSTSSSVSSSGNSLTSGNGSLTQGEQEALNEILSQFQGTTEEAEGNEQNGAACSITQAAQENLSNYSKTSSNETQSLMENNSRFSETAGQAILEAGNGRINYDNNYTPEIKLLSETLQEISEKKVIGTNEKQISKSLNAVVSSSQSQFTNLHKHTEFIIHRIKKTDAYMKAVYTNLYSRVGKTVDDMVRVIKRTLNEENLSGVRKNRYWGKELTKNKLYKPDLRIWQDRKKPEKEINMAITLLIDESGSMGGARISNAQLTAVMFQAAAERLEIPLEIYGHTGSCRRNECQMYNYCNFDCIDSSDKYRLTDIKSRDCNRDGAAVQFVAKRLASRAESKKLLIIISDGQPYSLSYSGEAAKDDLRKIKANCVKDGIEVIAAAIGSDREYIKEIYGRDFLPIDNLSAMPQIFSKILQNKILN